MAWLTCLAHGTRLTGVPDLPRAAPRRLVHHPRCCSRATEPGQLILLRHGHSIWNSNPPRFTGWANVDLTDRGVDEAHSAAHLLRAEPGLRIDVCYTSVLKRAIDTAEICVDAWQEGRPANARPQIIRRWRLNERHYGALTGLNKREALQTMDREKLREWRASFQGRPPPLEPSHPHYSRAPHRVERLRAAADEADEPLALDDVPLTESLADTRNRVRPLWERELLPAVLGGQNVLLVGHANNLRALISCIQPDLGDDNLPSLGVPNALPLVYDFDATGTPRVRDDKENCYVPPLESHYLGEECVLFSELDADGSGALDEHELQNSEYCKVLQLLYSDSGEILEAAGCGERLLGEADGNGDGVVDFNEYMQWWSNLPEPSRTIMRQGTAKAQAEGQAAD